MHRIEKNIHYFFQNKQLLKQALTHRSYSAAHNERLEFLGDAVLDLVISDRLFEVLNTAPEGDLSRIRAYLVRETTLFELGMKLGVSQCLYLGDGELKSGGRERPSIIADAVEAIIGSVYLDGGFDAAKGCVSEIYAEEFRSNAHAIQSWGKDAKTALQEWLQAVHLKLPIYEIHATHGALHQQIFEVECSVAELQVSALGEGDSRRAAEQEAAKKVLQQLIIQYGAAPKQVKKVH